MRFKLITFDFTGTLMRFRLPPPVQYEKVANLYGIEIPDNKIFPNEFKKAFHAVNKKHPNFGASTNLHWTDWWLRVIKHGFANAGISKTHPKLDDVSWHLIKLYTTIQGWETVPGVEHLLHSLHCRGQRMGVISNMDPRLEKVLLEAGLQHYFEFILPSYEANCFKPHHEIFDMALKKYSKEETHARDCCHIGDSYLEDFVGATQSGWKAILVNPDKHNSVQTNLWCRNFYELQSHEFLTS